MGEIPSCACWVCDVTALEDPLLFSKGMAALPWKERREKVERFRFAEDRRRCLGAALLALHALRQAGAEDLRIAVNEYGKPALAGCQGIHFNLSHSGKLAVCAVSGHPVGADVEAPGRDFDRIASYCFRQDEQEWMSRSENKNRDFLRLWTRKESYVKLLGVGLSCPVSSFSVLPGGEKEREVTFSEWETDGYRICVCSFEKQPVRFLQWRIDRESIEWDTVGESPFPR